MRTIDEYLRHATECERLEKRALTDVERETLRHMADTWRMLAAKRQRARADSEPDDAE